MRSLALAFALCLISFPVLADNEIVLRFTEEEATAACLDPDSTAALYSEDGNYMLICKNPNHWGLGKKAERLPTGEQLWRPVVEDNHKSEANQ